MNAPHDRRPFNLWAGQLWGDTYGGSPSDPNFGQNLDQNQDAKQSRESLKIVFRFLPGSSPEHPESGPAPSSREKTHVTQQVPRKSRKSHESRPKEAVLRPKWDPKIDRKRARDRKRAFGDGVGSDFCRCRAPLLFTFDLEINFWKV